MERHSLRGGRDSVGGGAGPSRPRGRGRGWPLQTRGGKRSRDQEELEQQPAKPGNRGNITRGQPGRGRPALTGANQVPMRPRPEVESMVGGREEDEKTEGTRVEMEEETNSMIKDTGGSQDQEEVEDPLLQGIRLGEL